MAEHCIQKDEFLINAKELGDLKDICTEELNLNDNINNEKRVNDLNRCNNNETVLQVNVKRKDHGEFDPNENRKLKKQIVKKSNTKSIIEIHLSNENSNKLKTYLTMDDTRQEIIGEKESMDDIDGNSSYTNVTIATSNNNDIHITQSDIEEINPSMLMLTAEELDLDKLHRVALKSFLQHVPCFKLKNLQADSEKRITKCRECRYGPKTKSADVYCRFYAFRRLQYLENDGGLIVVGFPNPYTDPKPEDLNIWQPDNFTTPTSNIPILTCRYILLHVGDQFCYLWRQECEALKLHENLNTPIAWKKVVQGVREICDVCDTTLFNFHWTCDKCGFSICPDCVKDRKEYRLLRRNQDHSDKERDEFHWFLCTSGPTTLPMSKHQMCDLMLTQIIAGNSLHKLGKQMHCMRHLWKIPQMCNCQLAKHPQSENNVYLEQLIDELIKESLIEAQQDKINDYLTNYDEIYEYTKSVFGTDCRSMSNGLCENLVSLHDPIAHAYDYFHNINFMRRGLAGLRRFLPPRTMTYTVTHQMAPSAPHEWLCDGKLLRLIDPIQKENRILFQEVWKSAQPVIVSDVSKSLDLSLWHPEAFCRDFGDKPNDLINCLNGNLLPQLPMRHFWEGFQHMDKRLPDTNGQHMLLKLKDWPPGDDFAEILPTRYADLMKGLPMPEYTLRTGHLNLASYLPKMFVPPDLGPKMYNAYGSALYPSKGTTNLHLDISDAVNIMVYVGVPNDSDFMLANKLEIQGPARTELPVSPDNNVMRTENDRRTSTEIDINVSVVSDAANSAEPEVATDSDFSEKMETNIKEENNADVVLPEKTDLDVANESNVAAVIETTDVVVPIKTEIGEITESDFDIIESDLDIKVEFDVECDDYVETESKPCLLNQRDATQLAIFKGGCDFFTRYRAQLPNALPGALWHIFDARDADKIRDLLNRIILEKGFRLEPDHDAIHDQNWYLDHKLRYRLYMEYGVEPYSIVQCLGDAVFIPAGTPHQVQNLHNCVKVAEDFVSPENISHCYHLTQEFRRLSYSHTNHEDKLQIKNIIYHAIKECSNILENAISQKLDNELLKVI